MNHLKSLFAVLFLSISLFSCQKEYSDENPLIAAGTAEFTYAGGIANCTAPVFAGTYMAGLVLSASNTVQLTVDVTTAGTYTISTNTTNGITFAASGEFTTTGTQTVLLTGSGTPTTAGTYSFKPSGGCSFDVVVTPAAPPAVFTLSGAPGNCTPATISGSYEAGVGLTNLNTAVIEVNVSTSGSYTIATNSVNGVIFSASGIFSGTGLQSVTLVGSGTPTSSGTFNYNPLVSTATCSFPITVAPAATDYIRCTIDGVATSFNMNAVADSSSLAGTPPIPTLFSIDISGDETVSGNDNIDLILSKTAPYFTAGQTIDLNGAASLTNLTVSLSDAVGSYTATSGATPGPFSVTISAISSTRIQGTFAGTLTAFIGTGSKVITNGSFSLPIQ